MQCRVQGARCKVHQHDDTLSQVDISWSLGRRSARLDARRLASRAFPAAVLPALRCRRRASSASLP